MFLSCIGKYQMIYYPLVIPLPLQGEEANMQNGSTG